jgi:hypothetical protein
MEVMFMDHLEHHGILGMRWGIRRYQNPDGTRTEAGKRRLEKKDAKWARRNYDKIYKKAYKQSSKEMNAFVKNDLNQRYRDQIRAGRVGQKYINDYNQKLAQVMNTKVTDITAPSGKIVQFVAKRGEVGVHLALADRGYDISQLKNGVYSSGRVAYKKNSVNMA